MANLSKNWITENLIDFEYKKYILLAYLNEVGLNFEKNRLYPYFSQVIEHYRNVVSVREQKHFIQESFPSKISKVDIENINLEYKAMIKDDSIMAEIEQIVNFSIQKFELYLKEGKKIYDFIEEHLHVSPVGIMPLNRDFGYLFIQNGGQKETKVYEYQITIFEGPEEKFRGIHTLFVESYIKKLTTTYESIKADLIKRKTSLPNPATYIVETDLNLPVDETLLPMAKMSLVKFLSKE